MTDDLTAHDRRSRHCPMLGHDLTFAYCRAPGRELPCRKVLDCWWEIFDVHAFMAKHFSDEQIARITAPPKDKVVALYELIEHARRRNG